MFTMYTIAQNQSWTYKCQPCFALEIKVDLMDHELNQFKVFLLELQVKVEKKKGQV